MAVDRGQTVCWMDEGYQVVPDGFGDYLVLCVKNGHAVSLYDPDYWPVDFFVVPDAVGCPPERNLA